MFSWMRGLTQLHSLHGTTIHVRLSCTYCCYASVVECEHFNFNLLRGAAFGASAATYCIALVTLVNRPFYDSMASQTVQIRPWFWKIKAPPSLTRVCRRWVAPLNSKESVSKYIGGGPWWKLNIFHYVLERITMCKTLYRWTSVIGKADTFFIHTWTSAASTCAKQVWALPLTDN